MVLTSCENYLTTKISQFTDTNHLHVIFLFSLSVQLDSLSELDSLVPNELNILNKLRELMGGPAPPTSLEHLQLMVHVYCLHIIVCYYLTVYLVSN